MEWHKELISLVINEDLEDANEADKNNDGYCIECKEAV